MQRRTVALHSAWGACMLVAVSCASTGERESPTAELAAQSLEANADDRGISWTTCPEDFASECAWVPLPLNYADPAGQTIPVFVSRRLASRGPSRAQLWLLQGGPGLSGSVFKGAVEQLLAPILPDVDFYVLEHRGVGESARLGCADFESTSSQGGASITPDESPACARALEARWGDGLAQFTMTNDAHDLANLIERTREQDKKVFLYGVSYGTSRALRFLQAHPDAVDAVVLDSVVSPGVQFFSQFDLQNDQVGQDLSKVCAADPVCGAKMGADPWARIQEIAAKLEQGHCPEFLLRSAMLPTAAAMLRNPFVHTHLFPLAYRLDRCEGPDASIVENYLYRVSQLLSGSAETPLRWSDATRQLIALSELWEEPGPTQQELQARCDSQLLCFGESVALGAVGRYWPHYSHDEFTGQWPSTQVPILAMNGTLDPQTTIATASAIASALKAPHQAFLAVPSSPHGVVFNTLVRTAGAPTCGAQLMARFLQDPTSDPDTSCFADLLPLAFTASLNLDVQLFGTPDIWDNTPAATAAVTLGELSALDDVRLELARSTSSVNFRQQLEDTVDVAARQR